MRLMIFYLLMLIGGSLLILDGYLAYCHNHGSVGILSFLIGFALLTSCMFAAVFEMFTLTSPLSACSEPPRPQPPQSEN
jgi:hypothetical protein